MRGLIRFWGVVLTYVLLAPLLGAGYMMMVRPEPGSSFAERLPGFLGFWIISGLYLLPITVACGVLVDLVYQKYSERKRTDGLPGSVYAKIFGVSLAGAWVFPALFLVGHIFGVLAGGGGLPNGRHIAGVFIAHHFVAGLIAAVFCSCAAVVIFKTSDRSLK